MSDSTDELAASFNRIARAKEIVRELWPWLRDEEIKKIAVILVRAFNSR